MRYVSLPFDYGQFGFMEEFYYNLRLNRISDVMQFQLLKIAFVHVETLKIFLNFFYAPDKFAIRISII
jgi:hypothetical protein